MLPFPTLLKGPSAILLIRIASLSTGDAPLTAQQDSSPLVPKAFWINIRCVPLVLASFPQRTHAGFLMVGTFSFFLDPFPMLLSAPSINPPLSGLEKVFL